MLRYEKFGIHPEIVDCSSEIQFIDDYYKLDLGNRPKYEYTARYSHSANALRLITRCYLREDLSEALAWVPRFLEYCEDYFFGPWRDVAGSGNYQNDPPDRNYWDRIAPWKTATHTARNQNSQALSSCSANSVIKK